MSVARSTAQSLLARHWRPIPVLRGRKRPVIEGWQNLRLEESDLATHFPDGRLLNVGVLLGEPSGGLVDIDLDSPEALALARVFLPPTDSHFGRKSKPQSHWLYVTAPLVATETFKNVGKENDEPDGTLMLVELRSTGAQTIFPGSVHPSGESIEWESDGEPARVDGKDLLARVKHLAIAALLARHWPDKGARHETALAAAGFLLRAGLDEDTVRRIVGGAARVAKDEQWSDREDDVRTTAAKLHAGEATTGGPTLTRLLHGDGVKVVERLKQWLGTAAVTRAANEGQPSGESQAQQLIQLVPATWLFHDERSDAYAALEDQTARRIFRLRGRDFRRYLAGRYYARTDRAASGEAMTAALNVLDAKAVFDGPRIALENRFARTNDEVWIDLADDRARAVRVTAAGWEVISRPPILFRRFSHQAPLPEPEQGGRLLDLLTFLNIARREDEVLVLTWPVVAMIAGIPRAILDFHGPQGSAKTTHAKMLRRLLDPSATEVLSLPGKPAELAQVLDHHAVPIFDNLGLLQQWQSDQLSRAVTGDGFSKRELYTDADDVLMSYKRAMMLTGINVPASAPDLLDRMLLIALERVPPTKRREERELWGTFDSASPRLFGALLDALAGALRVYPTLDLPALPRMADYARWCAAAAEAAGLSFTGENEETYVGADAFIRAMFGNVEHQLEEVLESDPVARAVRALAEEQGEGKKWQGTATELHAVLDAKRGERKNGDGWPKSPEVLSRRLRVLQSTLADVGVVVGFSSGRRRGRLITIRAAGEGESPSSPSSPSSGPAQQRFNEDAWAPAGSGNRPPGTPPGATSTGPSSPNQRKNNAEDTGDGGDGVSTNSTARECPSCGGTDFWQSRASQLVCRECHPPAPGAEAQP